MIMPAGILSTAWQLNVIGWQRNLRDIMNVL
jgi:hypothetical protein